MYKDFSNKRRPSGATKNEPRQTNNNTDLCVDVKTKLRNDPIAEVGKSYQGVLTHDSVEHYTFIETLSTTGKRNPHAFIGEYITITRRDDGTLRPNFKPVKMKEGFSASSYATGVANELLWALTSLLGK